ncbi:MAG: glycosyltransferase [Armatimonadetes bacterium]|nr:glycosyltransferase [Armatimonadota bacterium]
MKENKISIIGNARNEGDFVKKTVDHIVRVTEYEDYEIILVDDGSTDGSFDAIHPEEYSVPVRILRNPEPMGFAKSRNRGAAAGDGEFLVFIDCHILPSENWLSEMVKAVNLPDGGMSVPKIMDLGQDLSIWEGKINTYIFDSYYLNPQWHCEERTEIYEVPLGCGSSYLIRKNVFDKVSGYTEEFVRVGREDTELCLKACLLGYRIYATPHAYVKHYFKQTWGDSFEVHFTILHNTLCFAYLHFGEENFGRVIQTVKNSKYFPQALLAVMENRNLQSFKERYKELFRYDDIWYFEKFKPYCARMESNYRSLFKNQIGEIAGAISDHLKARGKEMHEEDPKIADFKRTTLLRDEDVVELVREKLKSPN